MNQINNEVFEDYVSFQVAKLLKDKGYDVDGDCYFTPEGVEMAHFGIPERNSTYSYGETTQPTHSLAIKWIRENFGLHIYSRNFTDLKFRSYIINKEGEMEYSLTENPFNSSEEATEAALLYTLQNLIK